MVSPKKEKILFVDDEQNILDVTSEYFLMKGYEVVTADSGEKALEVLVEGGIDCCFADINMPGMSGLELTERIREFDNTIPVVIMTGYPSMDYTLHTLRNGVVDFLIKPVNLSQMELCVQRVGRERQIFVENILLKKEVKRKKQLEKLNRELAYKVQDLNNLNKIMNNFKVIRTSSDVFRRVVDMVIEIVHADDCRFFISNDAVEIPFQVASASVEGHIKRSGQQKAQSETRMTTDDFLIRIAAGKKPFMVAENRGLTDLSEDVQSFMAVPLVIRDKVFGVIVTAIKTGRKVFKERDLFYLSYVADNAAHAIENLALYENIYENLFATLYAFVTALGARDRYTQQHSNRVTGIAMAIGKEMGCTAEEIDILQFAGHLHDIGKIGIRDEILLRSGQLTPQEFEEVKEHPDIGANILGQLGLWEQEKEIIRCHHERIDGTGYPRGLKGEKIPLLARILSLSDVFDAISSGRSYRKMIPQPQCLQIIREGAGTQFDPQVVETFMDLYNRGKLSRYMEKV